MLPPPVSPDEERRLEALRQLDILDTPPEERFDRITRVVQRIFQVPMALISLVDSGRQWFKSRQGLDASEFPREISFCGHTILQDGPLVVADTLSDIRFADNPLVAGELQVRFYAGYPLSALDRSKIGTLCILDHNPRQLSTEDLRVLRDLADLAEEQLNSLELNHALAMLRRQEQALRERESHYHLLADYSTDIVSRYSPDGVCLYSSPACRSVLGYDPAEIVGRGAHEFVHPEDIDALLQSFESVRKKPEPSTAAYRIRRRNGDHIWVETVSRSLRDEKTGDVLEIITASHDISKRKAIELRLPVYANELRRRNEDLAVALVRAQEAVAAKNRFLANISHELRTPLNGIIGFAELIYDGKTGPINSEQTEYLGDILDSARHLLYLINDILDLSKVEAGKMRFSPVLVRLEPLVEEVTDGLWPLAVQKRIRLRVENASEIGEVMVDPARFRQVLFNYLSNALKFTPEGGTVIVRTTLEGDDAYRLEVKDTGPGIPARDLDRLFVEFEQLNRSGPYKQAGTGLGLALTKRIVEAHGGHVGVRSNPGEGSLFFAVFPKRAPLTDSEEEVSLEQASGQQN